MFDCRLETNGGRFSMFQLLNVTKCFSARQSSGFDSSSLKVNLHDFLLSGGFDSYIIIIIIIQVAGAKPSVTTLRYANLALQMPIH